MYQRIEIIGIVGKDPVVSTANNGKKACTFPVAVNRRFANNEQETTWFRVTVWEKTAEYIGNYCQKGTKIFVEGRLMCDPATYGPRLYQRQDGSWGTQFEIQASTVKMIANYKTDTSQEVAQTQAQPQIQQKQQTQVQQQQTVPSDPDDIPW